MYPHRIRLRGPWECEPLSRTGGGPLPSPCRVSVPCRWVNDRLGPFAGRVRLRRRFGYPGRIDPHERVWLTFAAADRDVTVSLNDELLGHHRGAFEPFEFEVTARLRPRNELIVELEGPADGGLWGEVALEVRCPAFLHAPRLTAAYEGGPFLHVAGEVVGQGDGLEVYVLLEGRTVFYADRLTASAEGMAFAAHVEAADVERWWPRGDGVQRLYPVRVDLIKGGSLWYAWEEMFGFRELSELSADRVRINGREVTLSPLVDGSGNYLGVVSAEGPVATSATHDHCDREGVLLRQALPRPTGDADEDRRQAAALVARLQRHPCVIGFTAADPCRPPGPPLP